MYKKALIEGGIPLHGSIRLSGSKNSAFRVIAAAMLSNSDILVDNIPKIPDIETDLEVIKSIGGSFQWLSSSKLLLNGSTINSFEIPYSAGSKNRTSVFLTAALIYRFGKAIVPKPVACKIGERPINRFIDTWKAFGIDVLEDSSHYVLRADTLRSSNIVFSKNTHSGTDNALLFASFMPGESVIANAAEENEVDDLIKFMNMLGVEASRTDHRVIKVAGTNVFKNGNITLPSDKNEACIFATAAFITAGNVTLKNVNRTAVMSFINTLSKLGCFYEFSKDELRVWNPGTVPSALNVTTAPAPGFLPEWQPLVTLMLTKAQGEGLVHDTVYIDRFDYTKDLNRMGAKIQLCKPSEVGLNAQISDDSYDLEKHGEPYTVAKVTGPTTLKAGRLNIADLRAGPVLVLAALMASGKSEISGIENLDRGYDRFFEKLSTLGANLVVS